MLTKVLLETSDTPVGFSSVSAAATCVALLPVFLIDRSAWTLPKKEYLPGFLLVCVTAGLAIVFSRADYGGESWGGGVALFGS